MATQTILLKATSKAGTTRQVEAEIVAGKLVGTFKRTSVFGEEMVSGRLPIRGTSTSWPTSPPASPGCSSSGWTTSSGSSSTESSSVRVTTTEVGLESSTRPPTRGPAPQSPSTAKRWGAGNGRNRPAKDEPTRFPKLG